VPALRIVNSRRSLPEAASPASENDVNLIASWIALQFWSGVKTPYMLAPTRVENIARLADWCVTCRACLVEKDECVSSEAIWQDDNQHAELEGRQRVSEVSVSATILN
jgi:hypothetical protein